MRKAKRFAFETSRDKPVLLSTSPAAEALPTSTPGLRTLQEEFSEHPFTILAFPCNQFGAQEPGSDAEILEFATTKYQANFPIFSKINVNGSQSCDLYAFLKDQRADEEGNADISWNFAKFLVDGKGEVVGRFSPQTAPEELKTVILETVEG